MPRHSVAQYTNADAQTTVKANVKLNELQDPDGAVAFAAQIPDNIGAPSDAGDALRKGTRATTAELPAMTDERMWKGTGANVEEIEVPGRTIATGSYTGNTTARQITTGFKCSLVIIESTDGAPGDQFALLIPNMTLYGRGTPAIEDALTTAWLHATDGFGVSNGNTHNNAGSTYYYWAISE